jgi:glycolate oxidase FAD binding subunit
MSATVSVSMRDELAALVGDGSASDSEADLRHCTADDLAPTVLVTPRNASEAATVVQHAAGHDWTVLPAGGCTKLAIGNIPQRSDIVLSVSRMDSVLHYDAGDLTIGVEGGMKLVDLQRTLAQHDQFLPLHPTHPEQTVAGLLATALQGPLQHWAAVRDFCIGISFVTGDGKQGKGGGRVVKNVAGYDLMKLLIGSHGSLGVITAANLRVYPRPKQTRTFVMEFGSREEALAMRDRVVRSSLAPLCVEIASPRALEYLDQNASAPRDPDHYSPESPMTPETHWQLVLQAAGSDAVLARYRNELGSAVTRMTDGDDESKLWECFAGFGDRVLARYRNSMLLQVNTTVSDTAASLAAIESAALDNNLLPALVGRAGLAVLSVAMVPLSVDPPSAMQYANAASSLRAALPAGSSAIVLRCPTEAKRHFDVWGSPSSDIACMRAVKRAIDPKNILSRGRFVV